jgi:hypothetical protein
MYAVLIVRAMQADRLLKEGLELAVTRSSDVDAEIQKVTLYADHICSTLQQQPLIALYQHVGC